MTHEHHADVVDLVDRIAGQVSPSLPSADVAMPRRHDGKSEPSSNPPEERATVQPPPPAPPVWACDQRILDRFKRDVARCGVVGEETTAAIVYLALTSRLLDRPVSVGVKGHTASGKSYLTEKTCRFFPDEALIQMTGMSERALVYSKDDYKHRTIVMYELTGMRENLQDDMTAYFMRSLLSEGRIDYEVVVRDKETGGWTTRRITKEGPTNLVFTTTQTTVHAENETRVLSLATDDSPAQTARILAALANEADHTVDLDGWRALQQWLKTGTHDVTIPYAARLATMVPPVAVRLRRDFQAFLSLVRAHALLHRQTRETDADGRIIATIDDYEVVRDLIASVISEGVGTTVSPTVRDTVAAVKACAPPEGVTAQALAGHLKIDKSAMSRRLRTASDKGYVRNLEDRRGQPGRWVIGDPMPEAVELLPQPDNLFTEEPGGQPTGCTVARDPEGIQEPRRNGHRGENEDLGAWSSDQTIEWAEVDR